MILKEETRKNTPKRLFPFLVSPPFFKLRLHGYW